jgi:hypothetical protein
MIVLVLIELWVCFLHFFVSFVSEAWLVYILKTVDQVP